MAIDFLPLVLGSSKAHSSVSLTAPTKTKPTLSIFYRTNPVPPGQSRQGKKYRSHEMGNGPVGYAVS